MARLARPWPRRPDPSPGPGRPSVPGDLPRAAAALRGQRRGRRRRRSASCRAARSASTEPRRCRISAGTRSFGVREHPLSMVSPTARTCTSSTRTWACRHRRPRSVVVAETDARADVRHGGRPRTRCSASSSTRSGVARRAATAGQLRGAAAYRALARSGGRLMLRRRVIPCLDVADGRVVKGTRFVDLVDEGDPPELAERYAREGADELVFLDITAAPEGRGTLLDVVERTARRAFIPLTVGGGVRTVDDMRAVLRAGADKVSLNTAAVADPVLDRCAARFGRQAVVVAIDGRRRPAAGRRRPSAGRSSSTAAARAPASTRSTGPACRRARGRRAARHLDRSRRDRHGLRHGSAACHHPAGLGSGHRLGRRCRTGRLRGGRARRRRRRRAGGLDLPSTRPLDRRRSRRRWPPPVCPSEPSGDLAA